MFDIINIIGKFHVRAFPWLQDDASYFYVVPSWNPRLLSTLRVQVVLGRPFGLFHPAAVFLLPLAKLSDDYPIDEVLVTWPNKYNWFKWLMWPEKMTWNRICWYKLQSLLKFKTFFSKMLLRSNWQICISNNNNNIFCFVFLLCRI